MDRFIVPKHLGVFVEAEMGMTFFPLSIAGDAASRATNGFRPDAGWSPSSYDRDQNTDRASSGATIAARLHLFPRAVEHTLMSNEHTF